MDKQKIIEIIKKYGVEEGSYVNNWGEEVYSNSLVLTENEIDMIAKEISDLNEQE